MGFIYRLLAARFHGMSEANMPARRPITQQTGFRAVLSPHRSLSPTGFLLLMLALGLVSFATGMAFLVIGAWPVFGFFGLDVALVYVAFRLNYRSGRLYETVEIEENAMTLTRVHPSGLTESFDFNPHWVRVSLKEGPWGRADLRLASHGRELSFGRFLTDEQKRDFADTLRGALVTARGGPRI
jgi:uncharacterized membrane protein